MRETIRKLIDSNRVQTIFLSIFSLIAGLMAVGGIIAVAAAVQDLRATFRTPAPLRYDQPVYAPEEPILCPGYQADGRPVALVYTPTFFVRDAGTRVSTLREIWRNDATQPGGTLAIDTSGTPVVPIEEERNLPAHLANQPRKVTIRIPLPDLPPGEYALLVTLRGGRSFTEAYYEVPFAVPAWCSRGIETRPMRLEGAQVGVWMDGEFGKSPLPFTVPNRQSPTEPEPPILDRAAPVVLR